MSFIHNIWSWTANKNRYKSSASCSRSVRCFTRQLSRFHASTTSSSLAWISLALSPAYEPWRRLASSWIAETWKLKTVSISRWGRIQSHRSNSAVTAKRQFWGSNMPKGTTHPSSCLAKVTCHLTKLYIVAIGKLECDAFFWGEILTESPAPPFLNICVWAI